MPKLEKFISVADTILAILAEVGMIHIKAFFPHPYYHTFCNHKSKNTFYSTLNNLKKKKLINRNEKSQNFLLTPEGKKRAFFAKTKIKSLIFKQKESKKEKWDSYWRIVIFDIPNKLYGIRVALRNLLKDIGFQRLQHSVWVYPYKIPEFLDETLNDNQIKKYVRFILAKEIYYDWDIKKNFSII